MKADAGSPAQPAAESTRIKVAKDKWKTAIF